MNHIESQNLVLDPRLIASKIQTRGCPMVIVHAKFDGAKVVLPEDFVAPQPMGVIVIFEENRSEESFPASVMEPAFSKVWNNPEDEIYDHL
jgi:hypothetical protein